MLALSGKRQFQVLFEKERINTYLYADILSP